MKDLDAYSNAPVHVVRIESGRHPFQFLFCVITLISGLAYFVSNLVGDTAAPNAVQQSLPQWLVTTWSILLIIGPALILVGTLWQSQTLGGIVTGLILQKRGLIVLGSATLIYSLAIIGYVNKNASIPWITVLFNFLLLLAFSASCFWRWWHVRRDLRGIATTGTGFPNTVAVNKED